MTKYWQIEAIIEAEQEDLLSSYFWESGADGVQIEDIHQKGRDLLKVIAYFNNTPATRVKEIANHIPQKVEGSQIAEYDQQNWQQNWRKYFKPVPLSKVWTITPPWLSQNPEREIIIEPGQAFGTGTHASTLLILQALLKWHQQVAKTSLLDMGCGSGIVAILAAKLGFTKIMGVECDPICQSEFFENARLNQINNLEFVCQKQVPQGPFNVVVVNILWQKVAPLMPDLTRAVVPGGLLLLSGLLEGQSNQARKAVTTNFSLLEQRNYQEWSALCWRKSQKKNAGW